MSRIIPLLVPLLISVLSCIGQNNGPSSVFPGPPPAPALNFAGSLAGSHAIPPNNSPFTAVAAVYGPFQFFIPPFTNGIFIRVVIPPALLTNNPNIVPAVVSIQHADGSRVTDPYCTPPDDCPFVLGMPPGPLAPCNDLWCPGIPIGIFEGRFGLTVAQWNELITGQWYASVTFQSSDGTPLVDYAIRGEILPLDSDEDGIPDYKYALRGYAATLTDAALANCARVMVRGEVMASMLTALPGLRLNS